MEASLQQKESLTILAPAKINLSLEVLGKRPDGFHEILSVMQAISLYDTLSFYSAENINIGSDLHDWNAAESLVSKAVELVNEVTGYQGGVAITLEKRIPLMAGLGGDSSDAAATLIGLNKLWRLGFSLEELLQMAPKLGSDVAFFLYGGTALASGRGEIVKPLPALPRTWVVLVVPDIIRQPGKTKRLYQSLRPEYYSDGLLTSRLVNAIEKGLDFKAELLFNVFERVVFGSPEIDSLRQQMIAAGASDVHLAGSGPALFSLIKVKNEAERIFLRLKQQGFETYLAETLPGMASRRIDAIK